MSVIEDRSLEPLESGNLDGTLLNIRSDYKKHKESLTKKENTQHSTS